MKKLKWNYPSMDDWQKTVLNIKGNLILLCGRQVGKSEIMALKIAEYLLNNKKKKLLICSGVERQAGGLYNKVLSYIPNYEFAKVKGGNPQRTKCVLKNGSILITEPIGMDGSSARQHTVDGVIFEEMQLIPEIAYAAITPMLLTTGGFIWMLGTAWSTEGYAYERLNDPDFEVIRVNAEEVAELRPEPQRSIMLKHLENERRRLSEAEYMQEYLAIPSDKTRQIFPDELIKRCMTLEKNENRHISKNRRYSCGIDPAGLGEDEGAIVILDTETKERVEMIDLIITEKKLTTETTDIVLDLERKYNFEKIYIDDGGIGFGVFSELLGEDDTKNKTIPLNNSARSLDSKDEKRKRILKEDLYINLLRMMERGYIKLIKSNELRESLKSAKFEYKDDTKKLLISSNYNHPVEALTRAAWDAQGKDFNMRVYSIKVSK